MTRPVPELTIRIPLEGPVRVVAGWATDDDGCRVLDWIHAHPEWSALLQQALELERKCQCDPEGDES